VSEEDREADNGSNIQPDNGIKDMQSQACRAVSATPNVPGSIRPTQKSMKQAEMVLIMVTVMETRRSKGNNKK